MSDYDSDGPRNFRRCRDAVHSARPAAPRRRLPEISGLVGRHRRSGRGAWPLVPTDLRRIIEMRMVTALAGERAERLGPPPAPGYRPSAECAGEAVTLARDLADLSPRHVELLLAAEDQTEGV